VNWGGELIMRKVATGLREVGLRGLGRVYIREGTTDGEVLKKIFEATELNVMASKQYSWIKNKYDKMVSTGAVPLIIDCGANIGLSSLFLSSILPKARVLGVEPEKSNVQLALKNTAGRANIEIIEAAVHDRPTALEITDANAEKWAFQVREACSESSAPTAVKSVTINALMQRYGVDQILIVKVDIEGAEQALFRSNIEWLNRTDLLIIETHDWLFPGQGISRNLFAALAGRRFEMLQNGENMFFFFQ
jgi:FkbM family methyltransferase